MRTCVLAAKSRRYFINTFFIQYLSKKINQYNLKQYIDFNIFNEMEI